MGSRFWGQNLTFSKFLLRSIYFTSTSKTSNKKGPPTQRGNPGPGSSPHHGPKQLWGGWWQRSDGFQKPWALLVLQVGEARSLMVPTHGWMVRWRSQTKIAAFELVRYIPTWWLGGEHQGCHIGNETREHILEDTFGRLINVLLALLQTHGCWWRRMTKGIASNTPGLLGVDWEHIYIISIEEVGGGGMIMDGHSLRVLMLGTLHFLLWNLFRMCHFEDGNQRHFLSSNFKLSTLRLIDSFVAPVGFFQSIPRNHRNSETWRKPWNMWRTPTLLATQLSEGRLGRLIASPCLDWTESP